MLRVRSCPLHTTETATSSVPAAVSSAAVAMPVAAARVVFAAVRDSRKHLPEAQQTETVKASFCVFA